MVVMNQVSLGLHRHVATKHCSGYLSCSPSDSAVDKSLERWQARMAEIAEPQLPSQDVRGLAVR